MMQLLQQHTATKQERCANAAPRQARMHALHAAPAAHAQTQHTMPHAQAAACSAEWTPLCRTAASLPRGLLYDVLQVIVARADHNGVARLSRNVIVALHNHL